MRKSGILMHITSLPGPYGVGSMGKPSYEFIDFLKKAGQSCWQMLPLTPTGYGDSPYQSCSTFAGNHYLIDLPLLIEQGLLEKEEADRVQWNYTETRVDFGLLYQNRLSVLRLAYGRFTENEKLDLFCKENSSWLPDFALFMALKEENGGKPWYEWEASLKRRDPDAMWQARQRLKDEVRFYCFIQYLFDTQWQALRSYAHEAGVEIIGDVPIYVPLDSSDVWSNPELFLLDENLDPIAVAGCPPDAFAEDGQLWGNPLYRWDVHEQDGFGWWIRRLAAAGTRFDVVRIDHFRGLESYWSIPYGDETARNGKWVKGPDIAFTDAIKKALPQVQMIAEDLGFITPEVKALRDASGYPGMKVLEFAFDSREPSDYLPHTYTQNSVCYTGTHDNMTMRQWFETADEAAVKYAAEYMNLRHGENWVWGTIRTAMASVSDLCVVQLQDYLDLGGDARMNFPGTQTGDNWVWRAEAGCLADDLAEKIYDMTRLYGRLKEQDL
ncbi:MAG: 4-alpha-glucanotransferase [Oscillospiraceae bacterium]|nr:4-alpha-glucanotransferase [Oscillospiraceae bacterium]